MAIFIFECGDVGTIAHVYKHSQNTNSKKCISCCRLLNYEFFGESRQSKDGFNSYCRKCRNQKRSIQYGQANEPYILCLTISNSDRITQLYNCEGCDLNLKAICLDDGTLHEVRILIEETSVSFHIVDSSGCASVDLGLLIQIDRHKSLLLIKRFILQELMNRSLRIYETEDERHELIHP